MTTPFIACNYLTTTAAERSAISLSQTYRASPLPASLPLLRLKRKQPQRLRFSLITRSSAPAQVHVTAAAGLSELAGNTKETDTEGHDVAQEDKPRSRIVAEYLAHGYVELLSLLL